MRRLLDGLYAAAAWLAAAGMVATLLAVLGSIVARLAQRDWPGLDAYAGYAMAACAFLALAPTLRRREHIRVTLLAARLGPAGQRRLDLAVHAAGVLLAGLLAWYSLRLVLQSREFNDVSPGLDATPLWIPQLAMAAGAAVFLIAMADGFVTLARGGPATTLTGPDGEPARIE